MVPMPDARGAASLVSFTSRRLDARALETFPVGLFTFCPAPLHELCIGVCLPMDPSACMHAVCRGVGHGMHAQVVVVVVVVCVVSACSAFPYGRWAACTPQLAHVIAQHFCLSLPALMPLAYTPGHSKESEGPTTQGL
jgi:hypothetical protein